MRRSAAAQNHPNPLVLGHNMSEARDDDIVIAPNLSVRMKVVGYSCQLFDPDECADRGRELRDELRAVVS